MHIHRTAILSDDGMYRYTLRRTWVEGLPHALIIMLNPSTADALKDDATIRSLIRLLYALGYGGFVVVNLYAFRSTNPAGLTEIVDPIGPKADNFICYEIENAYVVVVAWGASKYAGQERIAEVIRMIQSRHEAVYCFGTTKAGHPRHPLYVKSGTELEPFKQ